MVNGTDIRFARFYTVEGPSKSNAGPFAQDDQGFVWFGTPYGLNPFDGYTFKVFVHDPGNPKSISSSYVNALFKDRNGTLWVACHQYLNRFDTETETFTRYPVPHVVQISQDAHGILWLSTPTGLYALNPASGRIRRYSHDPGDPASLESNDIKSSGEEERADSGSAQAKGLIRSIEVPARSHCTYPFTSLPSPSHSMRIGLGCFGSSTSLEIPWPCLIGRQTL